MRERSVKWEDPRVIVEAAKGLSGLDTIKALLDGKLPPPPIAVLLDFSLVEASEGRAVFELRTGEHQTNPMATVHGGVAATVLDSALGCAVLTTLPVGVGYTTVELHTNLTRTILPGTGVLRAEAHVLHRGRSIVTAQATLKDAAGRTYAHATATHLVLAAKE